MRFARDRRGQPFWRAAAVGGLPENETSPSRSVWYATRLPFAVHIGARLPASQCQSAHRLRARELVHPDELFLAGGDGKRNVAPVGRNPRMRVGAERQLQRRGLAGPIEQCEVDERAGAGRTGNVRQRSQPLIRRNAPCRVLDSRAAPRSTLARPALRAAPARRRTARQTARPPLRTHQVSSREVACVRTPVDQRALFARVERVHDDPRRVPLCGSARSDCEEDEPAAGQDLGAAHQLTLFRACDHFRRPPIGRCADCVSWRQSISSKSKREGVKHDTIHEPPARSCGGLVDRHDRARDRADQSSLRSGVLRARHPRSDDRNARQGSREGFQDRAVLQRHAVQAGHRAGRAAA